LLLYTLPAYGPEPPRQSSAFVSGVGGVAAAPAIARRGSF